MDIEVLGASEVGGLCQRVLIAKEGIEVDASLEVVQAVIAT